VTLLEKRFALYGAVQPSHCWPGVPSRVRRRRRRRGRPAAGRPGSPRRSIRPYSQRRRLAKPGPRRSRGSDGGSAPAVFGGSGLKAPTPSRSRRGTRAGRGSLRVPAVLYSLVRRTGAAVRGHPSPEGRLRRIHVSQERAHRERLHAARAVDGGRRAGGRSAALAPARPLRRRPRQRDATIAVGRSRPRSALATEPSRTQDRNRYGSSADTFDLTVNGKKGKYGCLARSSG